MDDFEYDQLVLLINESVDKLENLPDSGIKTDFFELLKKFDLLHREGIFRILTLIETKAPSLATDLKKDFVIQTLLMLYEFAEPEEAPKPVINNGSFIPVDQIGVSKTPDYESPKMPIWIPVVNVKELKPGIIKSKRTEDVNVLVCQFEEEIYVLKNECLDSILPLDKGKLEGAYILCPWHGCKYDVRTGEIQNGSGLKLETFPVRVSDKGRISVGLNVAFESGLD